MTRRPRDDEPGACHHVINRGIAKRPLFETKEDGRYLLSRVAREVRGGSLEVLAYTVMTTHFHAMVVSPSANLSNAFRRIETAYVRRFNRQRRRDGPLVRGRFWSRRVRSEAYRRTLVAYIDRNAAAARIVPHGGAYPLGSAFHYLRPKGPRWLSRDWVESLVGRVAGVPVYAPELYPRVFGQGATEGQLRWIEELIERGGHDLPDIDEIIRDPPAAVAAWFDRKARLADGLPRSALVDVGSVEEAVAAARVAQGPFRVRPGRKGVDAWPLVQVALLRELCALSLREIAARMGGDGRRIGELHAQFERASANDPAVAALISSVGADAVSRCHRPGGAA